MIAVTNPISLLHADLLQLFRVHEDECHFSPRANMPAAYARTEYEQHDEGRRHP